MRSTAQPALRNSRVPPVALPIAADLLGPVALIGTRKPTADGASMPEATIHEQRYPLFIEHKVGARPATSFAFSRHPLSPFRTRWARSTHSVDRFPVDLTAAIVRDRTAGATLSIPLIMRHRSGCPVSSRHVRAECNARIRCPSSFWLHALGREKTGPLKNCHLQRGSAYFSAYGAAPLVCAGPPEPALSLSLKLLSDIGLSPRGTRRPADHKPRK